jgi:preprotein translocase subunit SecG
MTNNIGLTIVLTLQMLSALGMIGLILVQHGKGADMGASFGSGSAGSVFGSAGSSNFLSKATSACAVVFFVATLGLAYFGGSFQPKASGSAGVLETLNNTAKPAANQIPGASAPQAATPSASAASAAAVTSAVPAPAAVSAPAAAVSAPASVPASAPVGSPPSATASAAKASEIPK